MKYGLYKTDISSFCDIDTYKGERLHLIVSRVSPKSVGLIEAIMWNVFCLGRCKLYRMYYNETMVHSSLVARGSFKFTFLRKNDIEIGPCWTNEEYRGRGIYPYMLGVIIKEEISNGGTAYMIVADDNKSSLKGITKAGFIRTEFNLKRDFLKRYIPVKNNNEQS